MAARIELMIVAGEASGDAHAGELIAELRRRHPDWRFFGCGGVALRAAGCELLVDARELAVVGLFEVASHLPRIYGLYRRLRRALEERRPAALILVDFPDFNLRLARAAARRGVPVVYFISPQLWAWRGRRVKAIRRDVRRMICIFPFEPAFYARHGIEVDYVGHPLVERVRAETSESEFRRRHGLDDAPLIALLPGSRRREVAFHLPVLLAAARRLHAERGARFVLPAANTLGKGAIDEMIPAEQRLYVHVVEGETYDAVAHSRVAIVASGTATLETALLGTPQVVIYRLSTWTYRLGRRWVKTPHFAMVNLIAGRRLAPELIQEKLTAEAVVDWVLKYLDDPAAQEAMRQGLQQVRARLGKPGAIARAAQVIEEVVAPVARYPSSGEFSA